MKGRFIFDREDEPNSRNREESENSSLHDADLYDLNEDQAGQIIDEATGKKIDNSTVTGFESLNIVDAEHLERNPHQDFDDKKDHFTTEWLKKNDPNFIK